MATYNFGTPEVRAQRNRAKHGDNASAEHTTKGKHAAPRIDAKALNFGMTAKKGKSFGGK